MPQQTTRRREVGAEDLHEASRRWRRLKTWRDELLPVGTIFRVPDADGRSHESPLDLMLVEHSKYGRALWWMVTSGYKAGLTLTGCVPERWIVERGAVKFIRTGEVYRKWRSWV